MTTPSELSALVKPLGQAGRDTADDGVDLANWGRVFDEWISPASADFRDVQYAASKSILDNQALDFDGLARTLDDLKSQLIERLGEIRRIRSNVDSFFRYAPEWTAGTEEDPRPMWERQAWRYQPWNLPAVDAPEWMDVGRYFKGTLGIPV